MKDRMLRGLFLASALIPATGMVLAQEGRDGRFDRPGQWRDYRGGVVERSIGDLESMRSVPYLGRYERMRLDRAVFELRAFQDRMRDGRFDRGRLDRAIDNMSPLSSANRLRREDRERLWQDLNDLRRFRAEGYDGRFSNGYRR
jgi:hypothetical protein